MLIGPQDDAPPAHGGDLTAARRMFPNAPEPFVDLSTGINPYPYPLPALPAESFSRLPDAAAVRRLAAVAAQAYGAPSADCVVPAPGVQILLPCVAMLAAPGRAAVLGPTYSELARAGAIAGHSVAEVSDIEQLGRADLAMLVNPNNPDGHLVSKRVLLDLADRLRAHGGVLVADESFAEVATEDISLAGEVERGNVAVLRSFGKFYGLAGLRLGFALTAPQLASRLAAMLGPWPVSGPAIAIGERALADRAWQSATTERLALAAGRLDTMLIESGLQVLGGTTLFRLTRTPRARELFDRLGRAGILVRQFAEEPAWLRFGLPAGETDWRRLDAVLSAR
jgi:cobalamin biosynthetic protein CobC